MSLMSEAEAAEAEVAALREVSLDAQKAYKHAMKEEKLTPRNSKRLAREAAEKTAKEVQHFTGTLGAGQVTCLPNSTFTLL